MPATPSLPERRPLFIRDWQLSRRLALWLTARNVSPNGLSLAGLAGGLGTGLALALTSVSGFERAGFQCAVAGIIVRAAGNILDGMVAVESGKLSPASRTRRCCFMPSLPAPSGSW